MNGIVRNLKADREVHAGTTESCFSPLLLCPQAIATRGAFPQTRNGARACACVYAWVSLQGTCRLGRHAWLSTQGSRGDEAQHRDVLLVRARGSLLWRGTVNDWSHLRQLLLEIRNSTMRPKRRLIATAVTLCLIFVGVKLSVSDSSSLSSISATEGGNGWRLPRLQSETIDAVARRRKVEPTSDAASEEEDDDQVGRGNALSANDPEEATCSQWLLVEQRIREGVPRSSEVDCTHPSNSILFGNCFIRELATMRLGPVASQYVVSVRTVARMFFAFVKLNGAHA